MTVRTSGNTLNHKLNITAYIETNQKKIVALE